MEHLRRQPAYSSSPYKQEDQLQGEGVACFPIRPLWANPLLAVIATFLPALSAQS